MRNKAVHSDTPGFENALISLYNAPMSYNIHVCKKSGEIWWRNERGSELAVADGELEGAPRRRRRPRRCGNGGDAGMPVRDAGHGLTRPLRCRRPGPSAPRRFSTLSPEYFTSKTP